VKRCRASGTNTDLTERKRAEAERIRLEQQLRQAQKAESMGRMAGAIAHHFNNMLGAVIGNLELALDDLPPEPGLRERITQAMTASRRAAEISRFMLTYVGQTLGKKEPMDLGAACKEALSFLRGSIPERVNIRLELPPWGPIILADTVHIKQILTDLISNAVEAIGEGKGEIAFVIKAVAATEIGALKFFPPDWEPKAADYACLSISDNGCGMDAGAQDKIFDPFFTTKFTGRGLGLAVVLGLVRAHDGAITVESSPGRGAVFRVLFPLHPHEVVPSLKEEPLGTKPAEVGGLALVVDDEPMVRDMAQSMLERMGYEVIAAGDGSEAVEIFRARQNDFRLVLLDLSMPGMNGWETLTALRALCPGIQVVLASGYDEAQVMQGHHPERPQAFLHKPYQMVDLKAALGATRNASPDRNKGAE
jgi:two-component system cell cycle sensor histidine kinase/response regulator CckA